MGIKTRIGNRIRRALRDADGRPDASPDQREWDRQFARWITEATAAGKDPNDVGDAAWANDEIDYALERHYLPHIRPNSIVLELGPGTGRLTRKVISKCQEMVLIDHSKFVCDWLKSYLKGKGEYRIYHVEKPLLSMLEAESVNFVFAHGVVEHLELHDLSWYFDEFIRVLKPGGIFAFNFDNISSDQGIDWLIEKRRKPGDKCVFRFYSPEVITRVANRSGFDVFQMTTRDSRFAYAELVKPNGQR